jgi:hypothetical protein
MKIKNAIWYCDNLPLLIFKKGFIKSIADPVVPKMFAHTPPIKRMNVFIKAFPLMFTFISIPAVTKYNVAMRIMNCTYSYSAWTIVEKSLKIKPYMKSSKENIMAIRGTKTLFHRSFNTAGPTATAVNNITKGIALNNDIVYIIFFF